MLLLAIANHEHVRNLLYLSISDFCVHPLDTHVDLHAQSRCAESIFDLRTIQGMAIRDRNQHRLDRREPDRECSCVVFNQNCDKALEASKDCSVDHDDAMLSIVGSDILEIKTLRHHIVELNGRALLLSPDRIG